jgi:hypothetical protein
MGPQKQDERRETEWVDTLSFPERNAHSIVTSVGVRATYLAARDNRNYHVTFTSREHT